MSLFTSLFHFVDFVNQQLNSITKLFDLFCVSLCFLPLPFVVLSRQSISRRCYNHLVLLGEETLSVQLIAIFLTPGLDLQSSTRSELLPVWKEAEAEGRNCDSTGSQLSRLVAL